MIPFGCIPHVLGTQCAELKDLRDADKKKPGKKKGTADKANTEKTVTSLLVTPFFSEKADAAASAELQRYVASQWVAHSVKAPPAYARSEGVGLWLAALQREASGPEVASAPTQAES